MAARDKIKMDVKTRADIEQIMRHFYGLAIVNPVIGHYFHTVHVIDLEAHIPVFLDFWETSVFGEGKYKGNMADVHGRLHDKSAFEPIHFETWLGLFRESVDMLFEGEKAELMKQRAWQIALSIQSKTNSLG